MIMKKGSKKEFKIAGYTIYDILTYFILYSIFGYLLEVTFGLLRKGVIECRQSFLYGPFCAVYGLGVVIFLLTLSKVKKSIPKLFIGGFIVGSITEYLISYIGELMFGFKWWDYTYLPFNLNGRITLFYSVMWGILSVIFIRYIHPSIERIYKECTKNLSLKVVNKIIIALSIFLVLDFMISSFATYSFKLRMIHDYNIEVVNKEKMNYEYDKVYGNETLNNIINKLFDNKKMIMTYPNLKMYDKNNKKIYFKDLLSDIKPYYFKLKLKN